MDWRLVLTLIAFALYFVYNAVAVCKFGAPKSLSMTYYLFSEQNTKLKWCFPTMMVSMALLLLPAWLDLSNGHDLQFMSFFAAAGIMFVGAAPAFKSSSLENSVHQFSAYFAALFAILWVCLVANLWYVVVIWLVLLGLVMVLTKTAKTSFIFWLETIAFCATFTSIIGYYLINFYRV